MNKNSLGFAPIVALIIIAAAVIVGVGSAVYVTLNQKSNLKNQKAEEPIVGQSSSTQPQVDVSSWQTYRNEKYGFEIKYPPSVNFYDDEKDHPKILALPHSIFFPCDPDNLVVCLHVSSTVYPDTNFIGAGFAINLFKRFDTEQKCIGTVIPKIQINSVTFSKTEGTFESEGNISKSRGYRTLRREGCFDIEEVINTSASTGKAGEFSQENENKIFDVFNQILSSFKFQ